MDKAKQAQEVFNKAIDVNVNSNYEEELKESIQALKRALKYGLQDGLDLNEIYTFMYCTNGDLDILAGDITNNWDRLIKTNWNGRRYIGPKRNAELFSSSLYELITRDNPSEIIKAIEEVQPDFTPIKPINSYFLTLSDLIDDKGYLKVVVLDNRYLIRADELNRLDDWIYALEEEEDTKPSYRVLAMDMLNNSYVELLYTADILADYVNSGIEACDYYVMDNTLVDQLYKGQVEGTGEGLVIRTNDRLIEVKFNNDDIRQYLDTQATGEDLLDLYQAKKEEIDKHFIREQIQDVIRQLEA